MHTTRIVEINGVGELAAKQIKLFGHACARRGRKGGLAGPRGEVRRNDGDGTEEQERDDIFRRSDIEGVERRQEKKVIGEGAEQRGEQGWPQAVGNRRCEYGGEEDHADT